MPDIKVMCLSDLVDKKFFEFCVTFVSLLVCWLCLKSEALVQFQMFITLNFFYTNDFTIPSNTVLFENM